MCASSAGIGDATMAIRASNVAFIDFLFDHREAEIPRRNLAYRKALLLPGSVIELQDNRVCLSAVDAMMRLQIFKYKSHRLFLKASFSRGYPCTIYCCVIGIALVLILPSLFWIDVWHPRTIARRPVLSPD